MQVKKDYTREKMSRLHRQDVRWNSKKSEVLKKKQ
jgi:hypothetical protein